MTPPKQKRIISYCKEANNCQRCGLGCRGFFYIGGKGFAFPLILCRKCGRIIKNGLEIEIRLLKNSKR